MTEYILPARVCVLADETGVMGGAAKATLLLCEALAEGGSRVDLFVTTRPEAAVIRRLEACGVSCRPAPVPYGSRFGIPARSTGFGAWLAMRLSRNAVLHAVGMQREVAQFLELPGRFRTFVWETTDALPGNRFIDRRMPHLIAKVEALLVPSHAVERNARRTYSYSGRTAIVPFWVEDRGKGIVEASRSGEERFLFVGRMDEDKGIRFLLPAFERARAEAPLISLDVCGSGDPSLLAELSPPPEGVTARGSVSDTELDRRYAECHALVLPSLHEGYPLTLLEACSFGKPVIATAVGSIPGLFEGRDCAILVPPGDPDALRNAMLTLLQETPAEYKARARDARRLYEEACSKPAIFSALARAYAPVR